MSVVMESARRVSCTSAAVALGGHRGSGQLRSERPSEFEVGLKRGGAEESSVTDPKITLFVDLSNQRGRVAEEEQGVRQLPREQLDEEDEDGVHGGRMKPLASFNVNRPPVQARNVKIKLASTAPKPSSGSQEKENRGLVPLCPGTTHIQGMKRKIISPKDSKSSGKKRSRVEMAGNAKQFNTGPRIVDSEVNKSNRLDMLLIALNSAEANCQQSESPSLATASVMDLEASKTKTTAATQARHTPSLDHGTTKKEKMQSRDEQSAEEEENSVLTFGKLRDMKTHRYRAAPSKAAPVSSPNETMSVEGKIQPQDEGSKEQEEQMKCQDEATTEEDSDSDSDSGFRKRAVLRPHRDIPPLSKKALKSLRRKNRARDRAAREEAQRNASDDDLDEDCRKPHFYRPVPSKAAPTKRQDEAKRNEERDSEDSLENNCMKTHKYRPAPPKVALEKTMRQDEPRKESRVDRDAALVKRSTTPQQNFPAPSNAALAKPLLGRDEARKEEEARNGKEGLCDYSSEDYYAKPRSYPPVLSKEEQTKQKNVRSLEERKLAYRTTSMTKNNSSLPKPSKEAHDRARLNWEERTDGGVRMAYLSSSGPPRAENDELKKKVASREPTVADDCFLQNSTKPLKHRPHLSEALINEMTRQVEARIRGKANAEQLNRSRPAPAEPLKAHNERRFESRDDERGETSCSEDDDDNEHDMYQNVMKPHRVRIGPTQSIAVPNEDHLESRDEERGETTSSDEYDDADWSKCVMRPHRYMINGKSYYPAPRKRNNMKSRKDEAGETTGSDGSDEKCLYFNSKKFMPAPVRPVLDRSEGHVESRSDEGGETTSSDNSFDFDNYPWLKPHRVMLAKPQPPVPEQVDRPANRACNESVGNVQYNPEARSSSVKVSHQVSVPASQSSRQNNTRAPGAKQGVEVFGQGGKTNRANEVQDSALVKYPGTSRNPTLKRLSDASGGQSHRSKKRKGSIPMIAATKTCSVVESRSRSNLTVASVAVDFLPHPAPNCIYKSARESSVDLDDAGEGQVDEAAIPTQSSQVGGIDNSTDMHLDESLKRMELSSSYEMQKKVGGAESLTVGHDKCTTGLQVGMQGSKVCAQKGADAFYTGARGGVEASTHVAQGHGYCPEKLKLAQSNRSTTLIPQLVTGLQVSGSKVRGSKLETSLSSKQSTLSGTASDSLRTLGSWEPAFVGGSETVDRSSDVSKSKTVTYSGYSLTQDNGHHQIAGITMKQRSWEALKVAERLAKQRFLPKVQQTSGNNVPSIPSRFQDACRLTQVTSSKPSVGSSHASLSAAALKPTSAVTEMNVKQQARGASQGKGRCSTKLLTGSVENYVQVKSSNHSVCSVDQRVLIQVQNTQHLPGNGRYKSIPPQLPSGAVPKVVQRGRKRKENKTAEKGTHKTKTSTNYLKLLPEPSGLLGEFNPGIMQRVRNSAQITAVLRALIGETPRKEGRDLNSGQKASLKAAQSPISVYQNKTCTGIVCHGQDAGQAAILTIEEKLVTTTSADGSTEIDPSVGTSASDSRDEQLVQDTVLQDRTMIQGKAALGNLNKEPEYEADKAEVLADRTTDIEQQQPLAEPGPSPADAGLAAQWLELLTLDIKGRLSALRESRNRVRSTLGSAELDHEKGSASCNPYSLSTCSSTVVDVNGNEQSLQSRTLSAAGEAKEATRDESPQGSERWHALFKNMDGVLGMEATKLENWLWQIHQMKSFCPGAEQQGLPCPVSANLEHLKREDVGTENKPPLRWPVTMEATEREVAVAASAASILSTANFVTKAQSLR